MLLVKDNQKLFLDLLIHENSFNKIAFNLLITRIYYYITFNVKSYENKLVYC